MRRLICAFVVRICHKTHFLMAWLSFIFFEIGVRIITPVDLQVMSLIKLIQDLPLGYVWDRVLGWTLARPGLGSKLSACLKQDRLSRPNPKLFTGFIGQRLLRPHSNLFRGFIGQRLSKPHPNIFSGFIGQRLSWPHPNLFSGFIG